MELELELELSWRRVGLVLVARARARARARLVARLVSSRLVSSRLVLVSFSTVTLLLLLLLHFPPLLHFRLPLRPLPKPIMRHDRLQHDLPFLRDPNIRLVEPMPDVAMFVQQPDVPRSQAG